MTFTSLGSNLGANHGQRDSEIEEYCDHLRIVKTLGAAEARGLRTGSWCGLEFRDKK